MSKQLLMRAEELPVEHASIATLLWVLIKRVALHPISVKTTLVCVLVALYLRSKFNQKKDITGKTVVLTGAGNGLGRAQALELAKQGCKVIIWDIDKSGLEKTASLIREKYPSAQVFLYTVNLVKRESIYELAKQVQAEHGFVWGLINNAGILIGKELMETPDDKIELTMGVNTMAHFWTVKAFLPAMLEKNDGHIVAISSAAGFFPSAKMTEYCTSKFAARGFMESLRVELGAMGKTGVKTTLVAPAHINTDLFAGYNMGYTMQPEWVAEQVIAGMQMNRPIMFLPWVVSIGNFWQGFFPTFIWDIFMLPTNASLQNWNPSQANKVFDKMKQ